jgi:hypothetical protein
MLEIPSSSVRCDLFYLPNRRLWHYSGGQTAVSGVSGAIKRDKSGLEITSSRLRYGGLITARDDFLIETAAHRVSSKEVVNP